jgi:hypothetical protein
MVTKLALVIFHPIFYPNFCARLWLEQTPLTVKPSGDTGAGWRTGGEGREWGRGEGEGEGEGWDKLKSPRRQPGCRPLIYFRTTWKELQLPPPACE